MNTRQIIQLALKEFRSSFQSPIAYIVLAAYALAVSVLFLVGLERFVPPFFLWGQCEINFYFSLLPFLMPLFIAPLTMRLFSEELGSGSYEILATLPLDPWSIVLGKYLSAFFFVIILSLPALPFALTAELSGSLDWGPVIGGFIGSLLLGGSIASMGLFASSLTRNQTNAFIFTILMAYALTLITQMGYFLPEVLLAPLFYLSTSYHFDNITKGVVDTRDIIYFGSLIFLFIYATYLRMNSKRIR